METYPIQDKSGVLFAFEIPSSYFLTSGQVARFFRQCPQIKVTGTRRLFEFGNEIWAEFSFQGDEYHVWEPYGDNSRFWVGPRDETVPRLPSIGELRRFVEGNWPGPISRGRAKLLSHLLGRDAA